MIANDRLLSVFRRFGIGRIALQVMLAAMLCSSPCLAASLLTQATDAEKSEKLDEAVELYRRSMLEEKGTYGQAGSSLVHLLSRLHRFDEAEQVVSDLVRETHSSSYRIQLGDTYKSAGNQYAAQRQYQEVLSQDPGNTAVLVSLGQSYEATGDYGAAKDCYNNAASKSDYYAGIARNCLAAMSGGPQGGTIDGDMALGIWMPDRVPLKIFIADGSGVHGYDQTSQGAVLQAISDWDAALHGTLSLVICNDEKLADIVVKWRPNIFEHHALGLMEPEFQGKSVLKRAVISIAVDVDCHGRTLPEESSASRKIYEARERMLKEVALHEFGHAFGLHHSTHKDDILANGIFGLVSVDVPTARTISANDINRIQRLYAARDKAIQLLAAKKSEKGNTGSTPKSEDSEEEEGPLSESFIKPESIDVPAVEAARSASKIALAATGKNPVKKVAGGGASAVPSGPHDSVSTTAMKSVLFNLSCQNYRACVKDLNLILIAEPANAQAHYLMAVTLVSMGQPSQAAEQYEQVLKLQPKGKLADLAAAGLAKVKH